MGIVLVVYFYVDGQEQDFSKTCVGSMFISRITVLQQLWN